MANMESIEAFLSDLELGQYAQTFRDNGITPGNVDSLTDQDLQSMGITVLGHRKTILKAASPPAPVAPAASPSPARHPMPNVAMPETYLWQAIVVTLFCCLPFGIMALVSASGVGSAYNAGNIQLARAKSESAKNWVNLGAGIWFVGFILWIVWVVMVAANV